MGPLKRPAISIVTKQKGISMWNYSAKPDILSSLGWQGQQSVRKLQVFVDAI